MKRRKNLLAGISCTLLLTLIAALAGCAYAARLQSMLREENTIYMKDLSVQIRDSLNYKIESSFQNLELAARSLVHHQDVTLENIQALLNEESVRGRHQRLIAAGKDGRALDSEGNLLNISQEPYFIRGLTGERQVSGPAVQPGTQKMALVYSVPMNLDGEFMGLLAAYTDPALEQDFLAIRAFGGEGYCHIVRSDGSVLMNSSNENTQQGVKNCFTLWERSTLEPSYSVRKIKADMQAGESGLFHIITGDKAQFVSYLPLEMNDWYLITVVPANVVTSKANRFVLFTGILCGAIVLGLLILLVFLIFRQRKNRRHLEGLAYTDPITGGPNLLSFIEHAQAILRSSPQQSYAMVSFNIQKFELINDTFGREQGNLTLRYILNTLTRELRPGELASRSHCDHFFLLLQYHSKEDMENRLEQISIRINQFNEGAPQKYYLNFTSGVFVIQDTAMDLELIIDRANNARKGAKSSPTSINPVSFYRDTERLRLVQEKDLENRMGAALKNHEFIVFIQPKYDLKTNTVQGAEALVRWMDPKRGLIPPSDFVPLFEKNGFIAQVDLSVFQVVCQTIHSWVEQGLPPVRISVNLSRICLNNPDFLSRYEELLKAYQIPAGAIEFELTETLVFEKMNVLTKVIQHIHTLGCTFSLDDFGSGYSSLNMLKEVPVDVLKLDRAFFYTKNEACGERGEQVVESVVKLARRLGIVTVAEGVERPEQVEFLRGIGCDMVQGFIFSKPLPIPDFEKLVFGKKALPPALREKEGASEAV